MTDWPLALLAVVDVLAVHRLTRLVTEDIITLRYRHRIIAWAYQRWSDLDDDAIFGNGSGPNDLDGMVDADMITDPAIVPRVAVLVRCRWCASVWIAAGALAAHTAAPTLWVPVAVVLALSSLSTLLAGLEQ